MNIQLEAGLSQANLDTRKNFIGGSDANILMNGSPDDILNLYLQKIGEAPGPDLDWVLPVQIGTQTEPLNVKFFEHETGFSVTRGENPEFYCPDNAFRRATIDGFIASEKAVLECKHVNQFAKIDEVVQKYTPQLTHNMECCGMATSYLSVFIGTFNHEIVKIEFDPFYGLTLLDREARFWECVTTRTPPEGMTPVEAPAMPTEFRNVEMEGNNQWADFAADWLDNKDGAKKFEDAKEGLKALVDADVGLAKGHGVKVKRAKNNSLRIGADK